MILDATNLIVGRFGTIVAKKALLGEKIDIVNCENAVITGSRENIYKKFKRRDSIGGPHWGPFYPKMPHMIVKRILRGMFKYKVGRQREAFERIKCHIGVPSELEGKKTETIKEANADKLPNLKFITIKELAKFLKQRNY